MKFKTKIQASCGIDVKMLDTSEDGFVLYIERKALDASSYKLLADFTAQNELSLQLDIGNFIVSKHALPPHWLLTKVFRKLTSLERRSLFSFRLIITTYKKQIKYIKSTLLYTGQSLEDLTPILCEKVRRRCAFRANKLHFKSCQNWKRNLQLDWSRLCVSYYVSRNQKLQKRKL